jgi:hypothetical protein
MDEEQDIPQQVADLAEASVPNSIKGIRACKRCGILKTMDQFINEGMLKNKSEGQCNRLERRVSLDRCRSCN